MPFEIKSECHNSLHWAECPEQALLCTTGPLHRLFPHHLKMLFPQRFPRLASSYTSGHGSEVSSGPPCLTDSALVKVSCVSLLFLEPVTNGFDHGLVHCLVRFSLAGLGPQAAPGFCWVLTSDRRYRDTEASGYWGTGTCAVLGAVRYWDPCGTGPRVVVGACDNMTCTTLRGLSCPR